MPKSHWNIACFRSIGWLMLTPIGRNVYICLKPLKWARGDKKASQVWTDQTRNQICFYQTCQGDWKRGKNLEGKSKIIWRHFRRAEIFQPQNMAMTHPWDAAAQPGNEDALAFTTPTWTICLQKHGCWRYQPWTHKIYLFFWLMLWIWPWATSPSNIMALVWQHQPPMWE